MIGTLDVGAFGKVSLGSSKFKFVSFKEEEPGESRGDMAAASKSKTSGNYQGLTFLCVQYQGDTLTLILYSNGY